MHRLGIPVPPAFIITTDSCLAYFKSKDEEGNNGCPKLCSLLLEDCTKAVHSLETATGKKFGGDFLLVDGTQKSDWKDTKDPLLLSVRSGAAVPMVGMMDAILNIGINDQIVAFMAHRSGNPRWAWDSYRRFLQMFGTVVLGIDKKLYEDVLLGARLRSNVHHDSLLTAAVLEEVVQQFKTIAAVPSDPWEQLKLAIEGVFRSWQSPGAVKYRDIHGISDALGTAVTVQSMVYGNMNIRSGSGVAFTRNPGTGIKELYGEYLTNAEVRTFREILCSLRLCIGV
jgi:pyruvate, orthophosphate dikinase